MIKDKFRLEDLYIGMEIKDKELLSGKYDTWIMLVKNSNSDGYTIRLIGKETNTESDRLLRKVMWSAPYIMTVWNCRHSK